MFCDVAIRNLNSSLWLVTFEIIFTTRHSINWLIATASVLNVLLLTMQAKATNFFVSPSEHIKQDCIKTQIKVSSLIHTFTVSGPIIIGIMLFENDHTVRKIREWSCKSIHRPFCLMCAIARVRKWANLSSCAICCTHKKSHPAEKVLCHRIFFFQSFVYVYERHF